jgi:sulfur transfer protein SufE
MPRGYRASNEDLQKRILEIFDRLPTGEMRHQLILELVQKTPEIMDVFRKEFNVRRKYDKDYQNRA